MEVDNLSTLLGQLELEYLEVIFKQQEIGMEELKELSEEDLEKIGITKMGHRKKILRAAQSIPEAQHASDDKANNEEGKNSTISH